MTGYLELHGALICRKCPPTVIAFSWESVVRLPPLNALRAFEATVRAGSLNGAAAELFVTPTAVSRHIKNLESYLGVPLFDRRGGHMEANNAGRQYATALNRGFRAIADSTMQIRATRKKSSIVLHAYTTLLVRWIMPRVIHFQKKYPDIELNIETGFRSGGFPNAPMDVALRYGAGSWPNLKSFRIFDDESVVFCAPSIAEKIQGKPPGSWPREMPILVHSRRPLDWTDWFSIAGVNDQLPNPRISFEDLLLVYQAAYDGLGIAITQQRYIADDVARGALVQISPLVLKRELAYYAVCSPEVSENTPVRAFIDWMVSEGTCA